jgi:hypothetical protein
MRPPTMEQITQKLRAYHQHYADCFADRRLSGFNATATFLLALNIKETITLVYKSKEHEPFNLPYTRYNFIMAIIIEMMLRLPPKNLNKLKLPLTLLQPVIDDYHQTCEMITSYVFKEEIKQALKNILELEGLLLTQLLEIDDIKLTTTP